MQTIVKSWWRRRSVLQICLSLMRISALISVVKSAEGFHIDGTDRNGSEIMSNNNTCDGKNSNICFSAQCIHSASEVLSKMKPEIQPCDDFYQFACGKYNDEVVIPEDKVKMDTFSVISDRVTDLLKGIITEERPPTDPKYLRFPNILYKACMNTTLIEDLGAAPIKQISEAVGGWPLIEGETWDSENKWNWQDTSKKLRKFGFHKGDLFKIYLKASQSNSTIRVIAIGSPSLHLDHNVLVKGVNETIVMAYYDYMVDIAVLFGADREKAKVELREVLEFEISLASSSLWFEEQILSIKQLQQSYPFIHWLDYINALLPEQLVVDENEPIVVPSFFDFFGFLLSAYPKRVIANYMIWQIHGYAVPFLSEKFRKRHLQYKTVTTGIKKMKPRWKECVGLTRQSFEISVGSLYVERYFKQDSKAITLEMVNNIRSAFGDILNEVAWMDDITKQGAERKLHSMVAHVGYPDELLDKSKLKSYYHKLEIDPEKYFESILKVKSFSNENTYNKLRLPINKTDWEQHSMPSTVYAFYDIIENSLNLPAGVLQGHLFNAQRPKYMNYGAIGAVIGHEITHGFDVEGQQYDKDGNLVDWWLANTERIFFEKVVCIREQYGNYTDKLTGLSVNGVNTLSENIADNVGIKAAYRAYRKWAAANGAEPKLPGLDFTPEQMFWISSAQVQCTKYRKESLNIRIITDVHSPSEFRVLGSFSNMKDFSKDFQCPMGSVMNPVHKCEVW